MPRLLLWCCSLAPLVLPAQQAGECRDDARYALMDFWVGQWDVFSGGSLVGTNRIERILGGCAVMEFWQEGKPDAGISLFYVAPGGGGWRQVWVTTTARHRTGTKEKRLINVGTDGSVRFAGELGTIDSSGTMLLDRTTLSPQADGTVRQVIENSRDGGRTWTVTFDAVYRRRSGQATAIDQAAPTARRRLSGAREASQASIARLRGNPQR